MPGLLVRESAVTASSDAGGVGQAGSKFGDALVAPIGGAFDHLADEGVLHLATNPTPGTGIASLTAPTTYVGTKPYLIAQNGHATKRLYPKWLKLSCTVAGVGGTAINYAVVLSGQNAARYTSGGSTITPVNPNSAKDADATTLIKAGALVTVAPTTEFIRLLGHAVIRTVIPVVGDQYLFTFGGLENAPSGAAINGTVPSQFVFPHVPCSIGYLEWFAFHLWLPGPQSTASEYEIELAYVLR